MVAAAAGLGLLLPVLQPAFYEAYAGAPASYLIQSASPVVAGAALAGGVAWQRLGPGKRRRLAAFVPIGLAAAATLVAAAREPTPSGPAATLGLVCLVPLLLLGVVAPRRPALVIGLAILGLGGGIAAGASIPLAGSLYEWGGGLAFAWLVAALVMVVLGRRQGRSRTG